MVLHFPEEIREKILLEALSPTFQRMEWCLLPTNIGNRRTLRTGYRTRSVSYSPSGRYLASGSDDQFIRVWDMETGICTQLQGVDRIVPVSYSPKEGYLASGSSDGTVQIWDTETGMPVSTLTGHTRSIRALSYSPTGRYLASGSEDYTIRIWNTENSETVPTLLKGHRDMVTSVSYSPTGRYLASGSYDGTVQVWDLSNSLIEGLRRNVYQMPSGGVYHLSSDQLLPLYVLHQFHLEQSELGKKLPQERPKPIMLSGIQHALELKFGPTIPWIVNLTASYRLLPP